MRLLRGLYNCPKELFLPTDPARTCGSVATIGNFDGVHLGHQAIIKRLVKKSKSLGLPSVVVLFEPHPQEFFQPDNAPARLHKLTDKVSELDALGVDYVLCLRFSDELAHLSAQDFVQRVLIDTLCVKHLFIGDDFRFGHKRQGDFALLQRLGEGRFVVEANESVCLVLGNESVRVSSSLVRTAIADGDFYLAEQMLGIRFAITGRVAHGDKQGRQIGVPTANIALKRKKSPIKGVYAVWVYGISSEPVPAVANIGVKPTMNKRQERLEVHVLDFDGDLYGKRIRVEPVQKLRNEKKFNSIDELIEQIRLDCEKARACFPAD